MTQWADDVGRNFVWFDRDRVPLALIRRRVTPDGYVDETFRDVDDWRADTHGSVNHAVVNALESDYEEVSAEAAAEFVEMVASRSYRPLGGAE